MNRRARPASRLERQLLGRVGRTTHLLDTGLWEALGLGPPPAGPDSGVRPSP